MHAMHFKASANKVGLQAPHPPCAVARVCPSQPDTKGLHTAVMPVLSQNRSLIKIISLTA